MPHNPARIADTRARLAKALLDFVSRYQAPAWERGDSDNVFIALAQPNLKVLLL